MSDLPPKPIAPRTTGLSPKAQKLQAMREKAANANSGAKPAPGASFTSFKAKDSFANTKKTSFQRKAT
jgi:hypothetical protein